MMGQSFHCLQTDVAVGKCRVWYTAHAVPGVAWGERRPRCCQVGRADVVENLGRTATGCPPAQAHFTTFPANPVFAIVTANTNPADRPGSRIPNTVHCPEATKLAQIIKTTLTGRSGLSEAQLYWESTLTALRSSVKWLWSKLENKNSHVVTLFRFPVSCSVTLPGYVFMCEVTVCMAISRSTSVFSPFTLSFSI